MKKFTSLFALSVLFAWALPLHVSGISESFDFGNGPGKISIDGAGFSVGSSSRLTVSDQPDSVRFVSAGNNLSGAITRRFSGLGGGARNNFTIIARFTLSEFYSNTSGGRPGSIVLFANGSNVLDLNNSGLTVQIITRNAVGNEDISITSGIHTFSPVNVNTKWGNAALSGDDILEWKVDVSFSGANTMFVVATLTRLDDDRDSQTVTFSTNNASDYIQGTFFGFGGRFRDRFQTDLHSYVAIPEPSTFALLAGGIAFGLIVSRRRRCRMVDGR